MEEIQKEPKEVSSMDRVLESTLSKTIQQLMGQELGPEKANFYRKFDAPLNTLPGLGWEN